MSRNKAENCCNEVKSYITREGTTMTEVVELLADENGWSSSVPNLSGKLRRGSLRHTEAVELADVPGYDIVWQKRKQIFCALRIWYLNRIIKENIIWEANRMKQRQISEEMLNAFLSGELSSLLEAVKKDDTLDLELRGDSVNIYYRGGSLFKITGINNVFSVSFDTNYCTEGSVNLSKNPSPAEAVANIPFYKQAMDWWFHAHPKYEREFQQVIARENNNHGKISNGTDYYIADIEFADGNARFDMVALKWLSKGSVRKDTSKVSLALIEVKYGDGALKGTAGIAKHLEDFQKFLGDKEKVDDFCQDMSQVFTQKCKMGLVTGLNENQYDVKISPNNPEVIFIFANHDPASKILPTLIEEIEPDKYLFPIMIARASNMGYGLYVEHLRQVKKNKNFF